jgi:hypothetical protein
VNANKVVYEAELADPPATLPAYVRRRPRILRYAIIRRTYTLDGGSALISTVIPIAYVFSVDVATQIVDALNGSTA